MTDSDAPLDVVMCRACHLVYDPREWIHTTIEGHPLQQCLHARIISGAGNERHRSSHTK